MRRDWVRTESRTVRPFPSLDECLAHVQFRVSPDRDFDGRTSFDASELTDISPEFRLDIDRSALEVAGVVAPSDVSLVIRLADLRLRRSELVFESAPDAAPGTWTVPRPVLGRFSWKTGVEATVALVLREDREPRVGQPYLRGHWVARKDFSVRPRAAPRSFPIERWTAEDFAKRGLPKDTAYWIDFISDDLNQRFENPGEALRVCLRADVYDALAAAEDTDQGRGVMTLVLTDILAETVFRGLREGGSSADLERGGLLDSALGKVSRATGATVDVLRQHVENGDVASIRAFAQAATEARRSIAKLVRRH